MATMTYDASAIQNRGNQFPFAPVSRLEEEPPFSRQLACVVTTISRSTVINGNITSQDDLVVDGAVNGVIRAKALEIGGCVKGDITCESAELLGSRVEGAIVASGDVTVGMGVVVLGDITAKNVTVDGNVKGIIRALGTVRIGAEAHHKGDIFANEFALSGGAAVNGKLTMSTAAVDMSIFDEV